VVPVCGFMASGFGFQFHGFQDSASWVSVSGFGCREEYLAPDTVAFVKHNMHPNARRGDRGGSHVSGRMHRVPGFVSRVSG
jgi:hypothetical protein